jgi:peroxiredoxin
LNERGFPDQCTEVLKLIGARFADHDELGDAAKDLIEQTAFREKVIAAINGGNSEIRTLFLAIQDLLKDKENLNAETLDNTLNAGQVLEYNGHFDQARLVFQAIKEAFKQCDDKNHAKQAKLLVEFAEKRLGVIGEEITIEGVHVDGTRFNWEKYKGKVVLVDFWASTSSPWLAELPNLKAAYDRFREDGFEIVGVNVDRVRKNAFNYLRGERLPWPIVMDEIAAGIDANPNTIRYGVRAVPFVMLVGRDGRVVYIHVRGTQLWQRVEDLLAGANSKNATGQTESAVRK